MSSAASTIPAKRNVFLTKTPRIPTLNDKPKKVSKAKNCHQTKPVEGKHSDIPETEKFSEDFKQKYEDEETWMGKKNKVLQLGRNSLSVAAKKKQQKINASNKPEKPSIKILRVEQYDNFMEERKELIEQNEKYGKRVEELELEVARIMGEFAQLYEDNERLRSKMDTGKDPLIEPYSRVFEDRRILREAESGYKSRIVRLEKEIMEKQQDCEKFQETVRTLRSKVKPTFKAEEQEKRNKQLKVQVEMRKVGTENETLRKRVKELETEMVKVQSENQTLITGKKRLEAQLVQRQRKMDNNRKLYQISFDDEPVVFGY